MHSRRTFLIRLLVFTPLVLMPFGLLKSVHAKPHNKRRQKFIKQGWVLQEGDL